MESLSGNSVWLNKDKLGGWTGSWVIKCAFIDVKCLKPLKKKLEQPEDTGTLEKI